MTASDDKVNGPGDSQASDDSQSFLMVAKSSQSDFH